MSRKTVTIPKPMPAEDWIKTRAVKTTSEPGPTKRVTIEMPLDLHLRVKVGCAQRMRNIAEVVREFLDKEFPAQDRQSSQS